VEPASEILGFLESKESSPLGRRLDVLVPEKLLDGPDVIAGQPEVGRKEVSQGMAGGVLGDPSLSRGRSEHDGEPSLPLARTNPSSSPGPLRSLGGAPARTPPPSPTSRRAGTRTR
jgi:hypothetical protein